VQSPQLLLWLRLWLWLWVRAAPVATGSEVKVCVRSVHLDR
jgi:hypothetical protein